MQRRLKLGPARVAGANVLREEISGYERDTERSIEAYARHVLIKEEIEADPDLTRTIEDTYLGGGTGDHRGVTPIEFLEEQRDRTTRVAEKAAAELEKYSGHATKRNDTIGTDPSLRDTQSTGARHDRRRRQSDPRY